MPSKTLLKRGFKSKAEELSVELRTELGLSKFKPLDAFMLAKHKEIPIFSVDEAFEGNKLHPAYCFMSNPEKFNALWMPNADGDKIIIHNSNHSAYRQQSNLMHELAHIILEHEMPKGIAEVCKLYNLHYFNKEQEQEAKYLGGCLQISRPALMWVLKEKWSTQKIAQYYSASEEMVRFRLYSSGAARQSSYAHK